MKLESDVKSAESVDAQYGAQSSEDAKNSDAQKPVAKKVSSRLEIFRATSQEEILRIRDIAHEFHAESRYAHLPFSEKKFIRAFSKGISNPHDTLAVYVRYGDETIAVLNAGVGDYYLGEGGRMATIYVMYVSAKYRGSLLGGKVGLKLIRMVTDWAKTQGAEELHIHATSGIDPQRTDKLLSRLGFKTYGGNYVVRIR